MSVLSVEFRAPEFFCPIEPAIHPRVDEIERRAVDWIDRMELSRIGLRRKHILGTRSAEFYARFAPEGIEDNVLAAALWVYWGFAFDDGQCDRGALSADPVAFLPMAGRLQRAMERWEPPADPCSAALQDVVAHLRACATPVQVRRFVEAHRHWLYCVAWQIGNNTTGRLPGLADYLVMRVGSAGGPPTIALLEIANGAEVPAREMDSPRVRALTEMTQLIASLDNDLHSYRKETLETSAGQNLVDVLSAAEGCPVAAATERAVALRDRIMLRFLRLREQTARGASAELRCYLRGLGHAIRGNIDWAASVPRYVTGDLPAQSTAPRTAVTTDRPHGSDDGPLPIPDLAWWWDDLPS